MKWWVGLLALCLVVLVACAQGPTCSAPYMAVGKTCCLDQNANHVCDSDEHNDSASAPVSCDLCPPKFVTQTEQVSVYRYVCENGTIMDNPDSCLHKERSNAALFTLNEVQNDSIVTEFSARPACRGQYTAAEVHIALSEPAATIVLQAKSDPQGSFKDIASLDSQSDILDDEFIYVGLCDDLSCAALTAARLPTATAHVLRARIGYGERSYLTRDILIDPTPEGVYGKKSC